MKGHSAVLNFNSLSADASRLRAFGGVAMAALLSLLLTACSDESRLVINSASGAHAFTVDVVDTPESRARGLMYVMELAPDAGMLFDFQEERPVSFWMRNTYVPLDMIFIKADGVVRNIHVNARPHDMTSIPSDGPVQYVLEIPGGRSVELGIEAGDTVEHARIR